MIKWMKQLWLSALGVLRQIGGAVTAKWVTSIFRGHWSLEEFLF